MKKLLSKEAAIGLSAIISLIILFVGIEYLKGVNVFKPANYYTIKYDNVAGLAVSAPVTVNGFQIGLVRDIYYDNTDRKVCVEISLDKDFLIPTGSKALLASDLLGTASIEIALSDNTTETYKMGQEIPGEVKSGLMDGVASVMSNVTALLPKLDSILTNVNSLLSNPSLQTSITRLDAITANLEKTTAALNRMSNNQLPATLSNVVSISSNLDSITGDLTSVTAQLKSAPIDSTITNLSHVTGNLADMTDKLNSKDSSIGLLLNDRGLYDHVNTTISNVDSLLIDLMKHPKKYVNFKLF